MDKVEIEFTCVRAHVPQLSGSRTGYCLMAAGGLVSDVPTVSTAYFDVTSWEDAKVIAERSAEWQSTECESQILVFDFRFNTITLTSTLNRSGERCRAHFEAIERFTKKAMKDTEVFSLAHSYGSLYVDGDHIKTFNPFFKP